MEEKTATECVCVCVSQQTAEHPTVDRSIYICVSDTLPSGLFGNESSSLSSVHLSSPTSAELYCWRHHGAAVALLTLSSTTEVRASEMFFLLSKEMFRALLCFQKEGRGSAAVSISRGSRVNMWDFFCTVGVPADPRRDCPSFSTRLINTSRPENIFIHVIYEDSDSFPAVHRAS